VQPLPGKSQNDHQNSHKMMDLMGMHHMILCPILIRICNAWILCSPNFYGIDFATLLEFKNIYENHHGLESVFAQNKESATMQKSITEFKRYEILMNIGLKTRFRPFEQFSSQTNQHVFKMDGSSRYYWCRFRNLEKHLSCCLVLP
jgi:hypothetical protein